MSAKGPAKLLIIFGADHEERIEIAGGQMSVAGSSDLHRLIGADVPFHRTLITRNFFRQQRALEPGYECILNLITEAEENGRVLENLRKLVRGYRAPLINRPEAVLQSTRDLVARKLAGIPGLIVPRVLRVRSGNADGASKTIERAGMHFPVILRRAGTHTGRIVGKFDDLDSIRAAAVDRGEHLATEFVDFRSVDGLCRKYRVFFIGSRRVFRHLLVSDDWNVHASDRQRVMAQRPEFIAAEEAILATPEGAFSNEVQRVLSAVRERMPLDFFGMDFGIAPDGRVVLFEANATMNFFPLSPDPRFAYLARCVEPARSAFYELLGLQEQTQAHAQSAA
jgi:glutathione synthase/RimK-type ligase-like ATP-grasp enzyme